MKIKVQLGSLVQEGDGDDSAVAGYTVRPALGEDGYKLLTVLMGLDRHNIHHPIWNFPMIPKLKL